MSLIANKLPHGPEVFDAGEWNDCHLRTAKRQFNTVFPLIRCGFIRHFRAPNQTCDNKLEISLRLASTEEYLNETQDGHKRRLRYPNVMIKIPGVPHTQAIYEPRDSIFFAYDPSLAETFKNSGLLTRPWAWECDLTSEIVGPLRRMQELIPNFKQPGVADQLDMLAMLVWQNLMLQRAQRAQADLVSARLRRIVTHLKLHFLEPIDFDQLAEENGFSRRSFFRHWHDLYQTTPAQFVIQLKLAEACLRLRDGDENISRIAEDLHFQHAEYFCRAFKKKFGVTPRGYRNEKKNPRF